MCWISCVTALYSISIATHTIVTNSKCYGIRRCLFVFMVKTIICCLTKNLLHPQENLDSALKSDQHQTKSNENAHPNATCQRDTFHVGLDTQVQDYHARCV